MEKIPINKLLTLPLLFSRNTSLIIYNHDSQNTSFNSKWSKILLNTYELNSIMYEIIFGSLLGDGCLIKHRKNAYFKLKLSIRQLSYLLYVFKDLCYITNSYPKLEIGKRNDTITFGIYFLTRQLNCLENLHKIWYDKKIKILPPLDILYFSLTPRAIAHWIMRDGSFRDHGLTLYTNNFTIQEVNTLISILRYKYGISCNLHLKKGNYRIYPTIYITAKGLKTLKPLIIMYIHSSILYKLGK